MSEQIENITMNRNWIRTKKGYIDIETWNEAVEAAALIADNEWIGRITSDQIRKLKK